MLEQLKSDLNFYKTFRNLLLSDIHTDYIYGMLNKNGEYVELLEQVGLVTVQDCAERLSLDIDVFDNPMGAAEVLNKVITDLELIIATSNL